MKYIIGFIIFLGVLFGSVLVIGFFLPQEHTASVSLQINTPKIEIWKKISSPRDYPNWRENVSTVEVLSDTLKPLVWKEIYTNGELLSFREVSRKDSSQFVSEIIDDGLPFGGRWTITLDEAENSTIVTIKENGKVYSAVFRFFSKFVFGHESTIKEYLKYLEAAS